MSEVMKVAVTGVAASVCAVVLRKQVPELAGVLALCACAMVLLFCAGALNIVTEFMDGLAEKGGMTKSIVTPVLKVTGISLVTKLSSDFCRDAKEGSLATMVETAGSVIALVTVLPLMSQVLELISDLL